MPSPGLGAGHRAERDRQLADLAAAPGQPCPRRAHCGGLPMYATPAEAAEHGLPRRLWRVDLDDWPGRALGGPQVKRLAHAACNRAAGAVLGNRLRGLRRAAMADAGIEPPARRAPGRRRPRW